MLSFTDLALPLQEVLGFFGGVGVCCSFGFFFVILLLKFNLIFKMLLDCMHFPLKHVIVNLAAGQEKGNLSYFPCIKSKMIPELRNDFEKRIENFAINLYHIYGRLNCNFKLRNFILSLIFSRKPFSMISITSITTFSGNIIMSFSLRNR